MKHYFRFQIIYAMSILCAMQPLFAAIVTINNSTPHEVWVGAYYFDAGHGAQREDVAHLIPPSSAIDIERPTYQKQFDRVLVYDRRRTILERTINLDAWQYCNKHALGSLQGRLFYITQEQGLLQAHTALEWVLMSPMQTFFNQLFSAVVSPLKELVKQTQEAIIFNRYKDTSATVRRGNELCEQERQFRAKREPFVRYSLKNWDLPIPENQRVPTISLVMSGGGYRAMLASAGFLAGAERIGLVDVSTYISSLSGSAWLLGAWYAAGCSMHAFKQALIPRVRKKISCLTIHECKMIVDALLVKSAFSQPMTFVDLYGFLIGNRLLEQGADRRHRIYLSDQSMMLEYGYWPMPIYSAIQAEYGDASHWHEFTPYEVGGAWLGKYVPTWAYGRQFIDGSSIDDAPEQPLSFLFGVFGSAFAARISELYEAIDEYIPSSFLKGVVQKLIVDPFGNERLTAGKVNNFVAAMYRKTVVNKPTLTLIDAGAEPGFNVPYPPISGQRAERASDVIIILDMSASNDATALRGAQQYAHDHGLPFPPIDYAAVSQRAVSIFKDEDNVFVPVVIYMPLMVDPSLQSLLSQPLYAMYKELLDGFDVAVCIEEGACGTMALNYSEQTAQQLIALGEFNMRASEAAIKEAIAWKIGQAGA